MHKRPSSKTHFHCRAATPGGPNLKSPTLIQPQEKYFKAPTLKQSSSEHTSSLDYNSPHIHMRRGRSFEWSKYSFQYSIKAISRMYKTVI